MRKTDFTVGHRFLASVLSMMIMFSSTATGAALTSYAAVDSPDTINDAVEEVMSDTAKSGEEIEIENFTDNEHIASIDEIDVSTVQAYILENLDPDLTGKGNLIPYDLINIKRTFAERTMKEPTIEYLYQDNDGDGNVDNLDAFITQQSSYELLYEVDPDADYLVGVGDMIKSNANAPVDAAFARDTNDGEVVSDCIYDFETGLIYVPKYYRTITDTGDLVLFNIRTQLLYLTDVDSATTPVDVNITSNVKGDVAVSGVANVGLISNNVSVKITDDERAKSAISKADITVKVNSIEVDDYGYDAESGTITVNAMPASVQSIDIELKKQSFFSMLASFFHISGKEPDNYKHYALTDENAPTANSIENAFEVLDGELELGDKAVIKTYGKVDVDPYSDAACHLQDGEYEFNPDGDDGMFQGHTLMYDDNGEIIAIKDQYTYRLIDYVMWGYAYAVNNDDIENIAYDINDLSDVDTDIGWATYADKDGGKSTFNSSNYFTVSYDSQVAEFNNSVKIYDSTAETNSQLSLPEIKNLYLECGHIVLANAKSNNTDFIVRILGITEPAARSDGQDGYKYGKIMLGYASLSASGQSAVGAYLYWYKIPPALGGIKFTKVDENNAPVKGAAFYVKKLDDKGNPTGNKIPLYEKEENGQVFFYRNGLSVGQYAVYESTTPFGYKSIDGSVMTVTVEKDVSADDYWKKHKDDSEGKVVNEKTTLRIAIKKQVDDSGNGIENCDLMGESYSLQNARYVLIGPIGKDDVSEWKAVSNFWTYYNERNINTYLTPNVSIGGGYTNCYLADVVIYGDYSLPLYKNLKYGFGAYAKDNIDSVYADNYIHQLVTDENGYAYAAGIKSGNYILLETVASKGFYRDTSLYEITLESDSTENTAYFYEINDEGKAVKTQQIDYDEMTTIVDSAVIVNEKPKYDPAMFTLQKQSDNTFTNRPLGGAVFHAQILGTTAKWAVKDKTARDSLTKIAFDIVTDEKGNAFFKKSHIVEDSFQIRADEDSLKLKYLDEVFTDEKERQDYYDKWFTKYGEFKIPVNTTVFVKETKAPDGYVIDGSIVDTVYYDSDNKIHETSDGNDGFSFVIDENYIQNDIYTTIGNQPADIIISEPADIYGVVSVKKTDSLTGESLKGAEFTITAKDGKRFTIKNADNSTTDVDSLTITTNGNGIATTKPQYLAFGEYTIKETKAPDGYILSDWSKDFVIEDNGSETDYTITFDVTNTPIMGGVKVIKLDAGTKKSEAIAGTTLDGVQFGIYNKSDKAVKIGDKIYEPFDETKDEETQRIATLTIKKDADGNYSAETANDLLPYGNYELREIAANSAYILNTQIVEPFTVAKNKEVIKISIENSVYRGDVMFSKVLKSESEKTALQTAWLLEWLNGDKTIDWTVIVTDENGVYNSSAIKHTENTNANGTAFKDYFDVATDKDGNVTEIKQIKTINIADTKQCGTWFGKGENGTVVEPDDKLGALPYGSYRLTELKTDTTSVTTPNIVKTFDVKDKAVKVIDFGEFVNIKMEMQTELLPSDIDEHIANADTDVILVDTVTYKGLPAKTDYTVNGSLRFPDGSVVKDAKGKDVTTSVIFTTPDGEDVVNGSFSVSYRFDASNLAGQTVIAYEEIVNADGSVAVSHKDLNDGNQTVRFPEIHTTAIDDETGTHTGPSVEEEVTIIDTVYYSNLIAGKEYTLKGTLMFKDVDENGNIVENPVLDENGNKITSSKTFTAKTESGFETIEFKVNGELLKGKIVVAFETLMRDGKEITVHADINDENQTIYFPEIHTTAKSATTLDEQGSTIDNMVIIDTVAYSNLAANLEYTITGKLMDKTTGKFVVNNGKEVTSSAVFTPETTKGTIDVKFVFDATNLKGHTLVVYEYLTFGKIKIAEHADINDKGQTIYFPEIGTTARTDEGIQVVLAGDITIVDTVAYKNLIVGKTYKVEGVLMDKATNEPLLDDNGNKITSSAEFTAESAEGTVEVTFVFSGVTLAGKTIVAFETLKHNDVEITVHADINDEEQTVIIPEIGTRLADKATGIKEVAADTDCVLVDTIDYANMKVGSEYVIKGRIVDKNTNETITSVTQNFKPETANGSVEVEFAVNTTNLGGHTLVAFERISAVVDGKEILVAVHEDINDTNQSVTIPDVHTSAESENTGDKEGMTVENYTLVDTVYYSNLIVGKEYTITGTIVVKATGAYIEKDGETYTVSKTFVPETPDGSVELVFVFDASDLKGEDVVAFETLYEGDIVLNIHADINDENQTIHFPEIATKAHFSDSAENEGAAKADTKVIDTVTYSNFEVGKSYTINGILMDKATNKPALDRNGNTIVSSIEFIPDTKDGAVDVEFVFDATGMENKTLVVFETVISNNAERTFHQDITDEDQSIRFVDIHTTLSDETTDEHISMPTEDITLVDIVYYENLTVGKTYTVKGVLMDKAANKPLLDDNGNEITSTAEFTPTMPNGSVAVTFVFSGVSLAGKTVVAFETLMRDGKEVTVHADINDENQTVYFPSVKTTAVDDKTKTHVLAENETITVIDTVEYKNVVIGKKYVVSGYLVDKATSKPVSDTVRATFTAAKTSGSVDVKFTLKDNNIDGKTFVAFEELRYIKADNKEVVVAEHKDINDVNQTVYAMSVKTYATGKDGKEKAVAASDETVIIDKVEYKNLVPTVKYRITGKLMNDGTIAKTKDGKDVIVTSEFTPETPNGTVEIRFVADTKSVLSNDKLEAKFVAFEYVYDKNGVLIGKHEDINDKDQTVVVKTTVTYQTGIFDTMRITLFVLIAICIASISVCFFVRKRAYTK